MMAWTAVKNGSPEVRVFNAVPAEGELWKASCDP